jgi:hypothetical protein
MKGEFALHVSCQLPPFFSMSFYFSASEMIFATSPLPRGVKCQMELSGRWM